jgi:hypothetical protein
MMNSSTDKQFVQRLKDLVASRYGKGLQIRQLMDLSESGGTKECYTRGRDLHIPIQVNGSLLGTAVVAGADDLDRDKQDGVTQLVRMVLEPAMYRWYLEQKETNLEELSKAQLNLDNVRLFGEDMPSIEEMIKSDDWNPAESLESELVSQLIHLEGQSSTTNKKVALQLHELTKRWAFVPFNDIKGQLHSSQDISNLGETTIFIENIENLNAAEQELIMDYLSEERSWEEPLIITCSSVTIDELGKMEGLQSGLVDELAVNCFEVDRAPRTTEALKEVLELFFLKDSPTQNA